MTIEQLANAHWVEGPSVTCSTVMATAASGVKFFTLFFDLLNDFSSCRLSIEHNVIVFPVQAKT